MCRSNIWGYGKERFGGKKWCYLIYWLLLHFCHLILFAQSNSLELAELCKMTCALSHMMASMCFLNAIGRVVLVLVTWVGRAGAPVSLGLLRSGQDVMAAVMAVWKSPNAQGMVRHCFTTACSRDDVCFHQV